MFFLTCTDSSHSKRTFPAVHTIKERRSRPKKKNRKKCFFPLKNKKKVWAFKERPRRVAIANHIISRKPTGSIVHGTASFPKEENLHWVDDGQCTMLLRGSHCPCHHAILHFTCSLNLQLAWQVAPPAHGTIGFRYFSLLLIHLFLFFRKIKILNWLSVTLLLVHWAQNTPDLSRYTE